MLLILLAACSDGQLSTNDKAPVVTLLRPQDGAAFVPGEAVDVCTQVDDEKDASQLTFTVQTDTDGVLFSGSPTACEGGNAGVSIVLSDNQQTLEVIVVDPGGQTGKASAILTPEANSAPACAFVEPGDGAAIELGESIDIIAGATDPDTDPSSLSAVVQSDVEGVIYEGNPSSAGNVELLWAPAIGGEHGLRLTVTDPRGLTAECTSSLFVNPCLDADYDGWTTCDLDCDDNDGSTYPGAIELADGADNDCNGVPDDGTVLVDDDGDGWTELDGDCDDWDPWTYPGAYDSWYDGYDSNCDGADDYDYDGDGWDYWDDCDDYDASVYPYAYDEWYDGIDANCDYADDWDADADGWEYFSDCDDADDTIYPYAYDAWYDGTDADCAGDNDYDQDADGYTSSAYGGSDCDDVDATINTAAADTWYDGIDSDCDGANDYDKDADGYERGDDCDEDDAAVHPGAADTWYDGVDSNCDGLDDDDQDADGYAALAAGGDDCNDTDASVNPGASDTWYDGVDTDCDGANDYDADADTYLSSAHGGSDCDDSAAGVHPGATDVWYDGIDANCDGASDYDQDADGYNATGYGGGDCADTNSHISPGETEVYYDGVDTDCDGASDFDADGDGQDAAAWSGLDCDDTDDTTYSGATELRDATDNDCDDACDEGLLSSGDILITEIMKDPSKVLDSEGEWFEVKNTTAIDIRMCGWTIYDLGTDSWTMATDVVVPAGGYAVLGRNGSTSLNGGVTEDGVYGSVIALANGADEIVISDGTVELDRVEYDNGTTFPDPVGASFQLNPLKLDYLLNNSGSNWCTTPTSTYGRGDRGTPGAANDPC